MDVLNETYSYMIYFDTRFIEFFKGLAANNNKEWFDIHRKEYENYVKEPFKTFISDLISSIQKYEPELILTPSECIFRINRDIRFSKDKSPYKLHTGAYLSARGKKDASWPGLYVQLAPDGVMIASGVYMPDKNQLTDLRYFIFNHLEEFKQLYSDPEFVQYFGNMKGEVQKRLPPELTEAAIHEPHLWHKQFYYEANLDPESITHPDFLETIMKHYVAAIPLNDFFKRII
jgi:uncharacterized protein (TIGR02453 family)